MIDQRGINKTIVSVLREHSKTRPSTMAFTYLHKGERGVEEVGFGELDRRAKQIAVHIRKTINAGESVILCYPPGIEYVLAFYGCLYAGVVAVPLYPPQGKANIGRFNNVIDSCGACAVLTVNTMVNKLSTWLDVGTSVNEHFRCGTICTDGTSDINAELYQSRELTLETLAFLQYTSGSTGDPKGVMITHGNIVANLDSLVEATKSCESDIFVNWLPLYHDLGLVNTILLPAYLGTSSVLMSPINFVGSPEFWLAAITQYKGTIGGGPNFCFELCVNKIKDSELNKFDLSTWRVAFNAAEPIYDQTLVRFIQKFESCGFKPNAFYPSYGMSETTVYLTGREYSEALTLPYGDENKCVIACGAPTSGHEIAIVNTSSSTRVSDREIGEIWASGPSIAAGYWNKPDLNREIFEAKIAGEENTLWLRTGDVGFTVDGQLYITGRIKEMVIIRGQNYYPTDIERSVQESCQELTEGAGAVFSIDENGEDRLIVVQELKRTSLRKFSPESVFSAINESVTGEYGLDIFEILLVKPARVGKTTSGKVQRTLCKKNYIEGNIEYVGKYGRDDVRNIIEPSKKPSTRLEILLAKILTDEMSISSIGIDQNILELGAQSIVLMRCILKVNDELKLDLSVSELFERPTIEELSEYINTIEHSDKDRASVYENLVSNNKIGDQRVEVSNAQKRLWFLSKLEGANPVYNETHAFFLEGNLHEEDFIKCIGDLIDRHQSLKTRIYEEDGHIWQEVLSDFKLDLTVDELDSDADVRRVVKSESEYEFDLSAEKMIRVKLLRFKEKFVFILTVHHIVIDGWSFGVLNRDLEALYSARVSQVEPKLEKLDIDYQSYSIWQRSEKCIAREQQELAYWLQHLEGVPELHGIPLDKKRPDEQRFVGDRIITATNFPVSNKIKKLCQDNQVTSHVFFHSVLSILISNYSNSDDVVIGSQIAGRDHKLLENIVGLFVNTIVLRLKVNSGISFKELLRDSFDVAKNAYKNQNVSFDLLVKELCKHRSVGYNPLIQIALVMQNNDHQSLSIPDISTTKIRCDRTYVKYDLELAISELNESFEFEWSYNSDIFARSTISRISENFDHIIRIVLGSVNIKIEDIEMMCPREKEILLHDWSNEYQNKQVKDKQNNVSQCETSATLINVEFERIVGKYANKTAIAFENEEISYSELNNKANCLASIIENNVVAQCNRVALFFERSINMVVAILAVLKSGATYVPIDPNAPKSRVNFILDDSGASLVLCDHESSKFLPQSDKNILCVDEQSLNESLVQKKAGKVSRISAGNSGNAYIIYTSGTTGKPKGVVVNHANVLRLFSACNELYDFSEKDVWTLFHSYAFDFSVWEMWGALLNGGKLVVVPYWVSRDPTKYRTLLEEQSVTILNQTPSAFRQLMNAEQESSAQKLLTLRYIIFGGEALDHVAVDMWFDTYKKAGTQLINMYGITETTVHATYNILDNSENRSARGFSLIGRPLPDLEVYILNDQLLPVPIGVEGELYICGSGVTEGYLNRPSLTEERFIGIPNIDASGQKRFYKTGDLVRFVDNGVIEYVGRKDKQVSINGFRIELGEIESVLLNNPLVGECTVLPVESGICHKQLVAFIVFSENKEKEELNTANILSTYVGKYVPTYMIPSSYVVIDAIPLTNNGKVDADTLSTLVEETTVPNHDLVAPSCEVERVLCDVWAGLFGRSHIGITDNFFSLGGDSIIAIQMVSSARKKGISFSVRDVFKHQTVSALKPHVEKYKGKEVPQGPVTGELSLLPIQRSFFAWELSEKNYYNQAVMLDTPSGFTGDIAKQIAKSLIVRHDALRLLFKCNGDNYVGVFDELTNDLNTLVEFEDLTEYSVEEQPSIITERANYWQTSIDISEGPLAKFVFLKTGHHSGKLLIVIHHLVVDGVSWRIIISDIDSAWQQVKENKPVQLSEKTTSIQEWSSEFEKYSEFYDLENEKKFWLNQLVPNKITMNNDIENSEYFKKTVQYQLSENVTTQLISANSGSFRIQINEVVMAAIQHAYCEYFSQDSLRMDIEGHGRDVNLCDLDINETLGWFTTIAPLHLQIDSSASYTEKLKYIRNKVSNIPNKGVGFGYLYRIEDDIDVVASSARSKAFVLFNYLGQSDNVFAKNSDFSFSAETVGKMVSDNNPLICPVEVDCVVKNSILEISIRYDNTLYGEESLLGFFEVMIKTIETFTSHISDAPPQYMPLDFPNLDIDQEGLDKLVADLGQKGESVIDDIYTLSTTQEEILFDGLYSGEENSYFEQMSFSFNGNLDVKNWHDAWALVCRRHGILRTSFDYQHYEKPIQAVHSQLPLPWINVDLRGLSCVEQLARIERDQIELSTAGFDFANAPLIQLYLYDLGGAKHKFYWNFHHILLDGWSMALVLKEVLSIYGDFCAGVEPNLIDVKPYGRYISWVESLDTKHAMEYWRRYLEGYTHLGKTRLDDGVSSRSTGSEITRSDTTRSYKIFAKDKYERLKAYAREIGVTENTLYHGIFSLLLKYYGGTSDVVFGETVSGRQGSLDSVENIVGLFIHSVPVRYDLSTIAKMDDWLRDINQKNIEREEFSFLSMSDIRKESGITEGAIFEYLLNVENYPIDDATLAKSGILSRENISHYSQNNFPFTLVIIPGENLETYVSYDISRFNEPDVSKFLNDMHHLLEKLESLPNATIPTYLDCLGDMNNQEAKKSMDRLRAKRKTRKVSREIA